MGGTAAISDAVQAELTSLGITVTRVAGDARADTAIEVAKIRGADSAADVARVTLVAGEDPDAWAGGFAAAAHSAMFDAPIVLGREGGLPGVTTAWLEGPADADQTFAQAPTDPQGIRLTCVVDPDVCRTARDVLDLPPIADDLALAGECPGFDTARLSGDGSTIVYLATQGCPHHSGGTTAVGVVGVDLATGEATRVGFGSPGAAQHLADVSHDGTVAAVTVVLDPQTGEEVGVIADLADGSLTHLPATAGMGFGDGHQVLADGGDIAVTAQACDAGACPTLHDWRAETTRTVPTDLCDAIHEATTTGASNCYTALAVDEAATTVVAHGEELGTDGQPTGRLLIARTTVATGDVDIAAHVAAEPAHCRLVMVTDDTATALIRCGTTTSLLDLAHGTATDLGEGEGTAITPSGDRVVLTVEAARVIDPGGEVLAEGPAGSRGLAITDDGATALIAVDGGLDLLDVPTAPSG
ncbi:hypothetical protein [Euzebya sp.]|uniref:hypothetical protein n=1 Tax=Euzebya sp. TaxID=1971409 RepID=UPI0035135A19